MSAPDDQIEALFADLRAEEMAQAPRFSALWIEAGESAAAMTRPARVSRVWWYAAAASAVIAAAVVAGYLSHDDPRVDESLPEVAAYPSIESWSAPTDALLKHARGATVAPPAAFGSVLDGLATDLRSSNSYK
jgi:hypothetical protein